MSFELAIRELADNVQSVAPGFVLVFIRVAAMMIFAPLLGSAKIPRRVKALMTVIIALGIAQGIPMPQALPQTTWEITLGIAGEICFGLAIGTMLSFVFIATQWAGDMIGHQMGLNISEVLDPQFGAAGSLVGDMYFMVTTVIFMAVGGHRALLTGVRYSFDVLPLLSVGLNKPLFNILVGMLSATTSLAVQLAGPMLVTMLIVDLSLGCISKTMPQLNVMTAGLSIRAVVGMAVLIVGLMLTSKVLEESVVKAMQDAQGEYFNLRAQ